VSTFADAHAKAPKTAAKIVVLKPDDFAHDWPQRPMSDVAVGLRRLSERDVKIAKEMARKVISRDHVREGKVMDTDLAWESYNDELVRYCMARAAVDPNDSDKTYFNYAEDTIHQALTSEGLRRLWDAWTLLNLSGPASPVANDEELKRLGRILGKPQVLSSLGIAETEARKLLAYVLEQLGVLDVEPEDDEEDGYRVVTHEPAEVGADRA
jgi:hypothetical protein